MTDLAHFDDQGAEWQRSCDGQKGLKGWAKGVGRLLLRSTAALVRFAHRSPFRSPPIRETVGYRGERG